MALLGELRLDEIGVVALEPAPDLPGELRVETRVADEKDEQEEECNP